MEKIEETKEDPLSRNQDQGDNSGQVSSKSEKGDMVMLPPSMEPYSLGSGPSGDQSLLPLDAREIYRLKTSWRAVRRQIQDAGVEIFLGYKIIAFSYKSFCLSSPSILSYKSSL